MPGFVLVIPVAGRPGRFVGVLIAAGIKSDKIRPIKSFYPTLIKMGIKKLLILPATDYS
jgi:hypothetical protein